MLETCAEKSGAGRRPLPLLFQVKDPKQFADARHDGATDFFPTPGPHNRLMGDVRAAVQAALAAQSLDDILIAPMRATSSSAISPCSSARAGPARARPRGCAPADFGGGGQRDALQAGEIDRLNRDGGNRRLQDAVRAGKIGRLPRRAATQGHLDRINLAVGLAAAGREEERKRFIQSADSNPVAGSPRL